MFGYIRPCRPELKIKDEARFRAYYCGICKALGRTLDELFWENE